jgi:hypothetical protein
MHKKLSRFQGHTHVLIVMCVNCFYIKILANSPLCVLYICSVMCYFRLLNSTTFAELHDKFLTFEPDVAKVVKIERLRWLGQLLRMQELDPCRNLTLLKPAGTRRIGRPKLR